MRVRQLSPRWLSGWLARLSLAAVFGMAAVPKILDPAAFVAAIDNYHLLPGLLSRIVAVGLPVAELCIAACLLVPKLARGASALAACLLFSFAAAMAQAIVREIDLDCGCFGTSAEVGVNWWSVGRNVALSALAAWSIVTSPVPPTTPPATLTDT